MAGPDEAAQAAALARARRNATTLLVVVAAAFLGSTQLSDTTAAGYLTAALEAAVVGGLADWFAVVALFRHPLGLPIPHTAVIPRTKDGLGRNLATFVEGNFLAEERVRERVADPATLDRIAGWLADPVNADTLVARGAGLLDDVLGAVDEQAVLSAATTAVRRRLHELPLSQLAGEALEDAVANARHDPLVTAVLEGAVGTIARNRGALRRRLGEQSPAWVPELVDDLVFDRGEQVVRTFLRQVAADDEHELRRALDEQLLAVTSRMRADADTQQRVDAAVRDVVDDELVARWVTVWWRQLRVAVAAAAGEDDRGRRLRASSTAQLAALGGRLRTDEQLRERALGALGRLAGPVADTGQREVGALIEATVENWDPQDTSRRLELWLGRDLQFVRINGTVVGAVVGLALHGAQALLA